MKKIFIELLILPLIVGILVILFQHYYFKPDQKNNNIETNIENNSKFSLPIEAHGVGFAKESEKYTEIGKEHAKKAALLDAKVNAISIIAGEYIESIKKSKSSILEEDTIYATVKAYVNNISPKIVSFRYSEDSGRAEVNIKVDKSKIKVKGYR
ncbi:MAG: hypothetical protein ACWA44_15450 [Thiotrichales bacterium]